MFANSRDVIIFTLAASVALLTFFICWILFYVVSMFRDMRNVVRDVTKAIEKFNSVLDFAKEKISNVTALFPLIIKTAEKIVETIGALKEKRRTRRSAENEQNTNQK